MLNHFSFLLLLTQIIASEPSWYTEPNTRQAITFAVDSVEHGFKLTPKDAEASAGFEIRFNADLKSNGYFVAPETLAIRALNKQHKDTLSFLLPRFGYHYSAEEQVPKAEFSVQARQLSQPSKNDVVKILIFVNEPEPVATLMLDLTANEATLIENRPYSMAPFLLELIAFEPRKDQNIGSCLRRYSNDSYICKKPGNLTRFQM